MIGFVAFAKKCHARRSKTIRYHFQRTCFTAEESD
jgi:hypothetical protein